ncbi:hypothetical protein KEM48_014311 [Puccinia striiformis f. sp. tritici PST-130]|nr:hypothetical protein KEM48_014311 [Puccinia striiformis f. sp. tritici PST-130]
MEEMNLEPNQQFGPGFRAIDISMMGIHQLPITSTMQASQLLQRLAQWTHQYCSRVKSIHNFFRPASSAYQNN